MTTSKIVRNHKATGELSQAYIVARLIEVGYNVLMPYGDNLRYDLVIEDIEGNLRRIQCKTGWIEKDGASIEFAAASTYYHTKAGRTGYGRKNYQGQIDYFAVYCPAIKKTYLVPVNQVGKTEAILRLLPTRNNQEKGVRWANEYEL